MHTRFRSIQGLLLAALFALATPFLCAAQLESPADLQWIRVNDERLQWLNVSDWEPRGDGLQPVRVPKVWRDKWPARTASRAQSAAGVTARFRTDSKKLVFRVTFVDVADTPGTPEATWERSRPSYFDLYRDSKYLASIAAATKFTQQDVTLYNDPELSGEAEIAVLFPFYYRNAELIVHGIGIDPTAKLLRAIPDTRRRVLFHGDSITHGHGVTSPRETYVWQACERQTAFRSIMVLAVRRGGTISSRKPSRAGPIGMFSSLRWERTPLAGGFVRQTGDSGAIREKYHAFLSTIREKVPNKPILSMTPIFNRFDLKPTKNKNGEIPQDYRNAITQIVRQRHASDRNLHLLDGLQLINDPLYLWVSRCGPSQ